jgi:hypothetical protein
MIMMGLSLDFLPDALAQSRDNPSEFDIYMPTVDGKAVHYNVDDPT